MIIVGTNQISYPQLRNFVQLPYRAVRFKKLMDYYRIPAYLKFKSTGKIDYTLLNKFNDFGLNKVDLYHFFNVISPIKRPWVATFETSLPRLQPAFGKGYDWMASKHCKRIIAFSNRALVHQEQNLIRFPDQAEAIRSKLVVMHPAQSLFCSEIPRKLPEIVHLVFVGRSFFGKGGYQLLQAFQLAKQRKMPMRLTVVSSLSIDGYRDQFVDVEITTHTKKMLQEIPDVEYHETMTNSEVLQLLKQADIGVLPSFGETYGYFLLEAMASGCAVIKTDISPFDEVAPVSCSYSVSLGLQKGQAEVRSTDLSDKNKFNQINERLTEDLLQTFDNICNDGVSLLSKKHAAIERVRRFHDPLLRAQELENIYAEIKSGAL